MADLILPLKAVYFDQIAAGAKLEEYRLANAYWTRRLIGAGGAHRCFDRIILTKGYPPRDDAARRLVRAWRGFQRKTITHPHFGPKPVEIFAIDVSCTSAVDDLIVAWLLKMQLRGVERDDSHGLMTTAQVARGVSMKKPEARRALEALAASGRIRKLVYANGLCWRSVNPLPWEPGGTWPDGRPLLPPPPSETVQVSRKEIQDAMDHVNRLPERTIRLMKKWIAQ